MSNHGDKRIKKADVKRVGSVADQLYNQLWSAIVQQDIKPGEKIVELNIAADYGTSQGPVREALQRLAFDGLVERHARSATYVTPLRPDDMMEFFSIRSLVESYVIRRVIRTITPEQIEELDDLIEMMRQCGRDNDLRKLIDYDMAFHRSLCEWSENKILLNIWLSLYSQIQRFIMQTHRQFFPNLVDLANTHQPIVDALRNKDVDEAVRQVEEHVMYIWSFISPDGIEVENIKEPR
jgi:DNA-binding GntR family transcriptional regulator